MSEATSVGEKLLSEIERVSAKRERWRGYARESGSQVSYAPAIFLMTAAIDEAKAALMGDDVIKCIAALKDLEGYDDDD